MSEPTDGLGWAQAYCRRGWRLVPIPPGQKRPVLPCWPDLVVEPENVPRLFRSGENVAVLLGGKSGALVDVDLDCPEAIELADLYLLKTGAEFGRKSKPRSHRLYIAPAAQHETFADPVSGGMLVELRTDGREGGAHLSLLPPSIADGERREWHGNTIAPIVISAAVLRHATAWLAVACLVMRYIGEHPARQPGPDLPRLLWEIDHELGRPAYRWLGMPPPDAPQRFPRKRSNLSDHDLNLAEIVAAIPNDFGWEEWNRAGLASDLRRISRIR